MTTSEFNIQCAIADYLRERGVLFTATVGGVAYKPHQRKRMYDSGYCRGVPDLAIFEPRGVHCGLFIEVKKPTGRLSAYQRSYMTRLRARRYMAVTCFSLRGAIDIIDFYLGLDHPGLSDGVDGLLALDDSEATQDAEAPTEPVHASRTASRGSEVRRASKRRRQSPVRELVEAMNDEASD